MTIDPAAELVRATRRAASACLPLSCLALPCLPLSAAAPTSPPSNAVGAERRRAPRRPPPTATGGPPLPYSPPIAPRGGGTKRLPESRSRAATTGTRPARAWTASSAASSSSAGRAAAGPSARSTSVIHSFIHSPIPPPPRFRPSLLHLLFVALCWASLTAPTPPLLLLLLLCFSHAHRHLRDRRRQNREHILLSPTRFLFDFAGIRLEFRGLRCHL
jgi:hypothetical protein